MTGEPVAHRHGLGRTHSAHLNMPASIAAPAPSQIEVPLVATRRAFAMAFPNPTAIGGTTVPAVLARQRRSGRAGEDPALRPPAPAG